MADGVVKPASIFYSYSHRDEDLRLELEAHLASLRRSGIICEWHDRKIDPGQDWKNQINQHVESAQIILFLISSDFINSGYCMDVEVARALDRHKKKEAVIIPVILRPVVWQVIPWLHDLQALPKNALPVIQWSPRDLAYVSVCEGLLHLLHKPVPMDVLRRATTSRGRKRFFDAAIPARVPVHKPSALLVMVRRSDSPGLTNVLEAEPHYGISRDDVRSKAATLHFPTQDGTPQPLDLVVKVEAPEFARKSQSKTIHLPPKGDSQPHVFFVTPKELGKLVLNVELCLGKQQLASCMLRTVGVGDEGREVLNQSVTSILVADVEEIVEAADSSNPAASSSAIDPSNTERVRNHSSEPNKLTEEPTVSVPDWTKYGVTLGAIFLVACLAGWMSLRLRESDAKAMREVTAALESVEKKLTTEMQRNARNSIPVFEKRDAEERYVSLKKKEPATRGGELQTQNATAGNDVNGIALERLPSISRDTSTFLTLQPGISPDGSVAGAAVDQSTFQLGMGSNAIQAQLAKTYDDALSGDTDAMVQVGLAYRKAAVIGSAEKDFEIAFSLNPKANAVPDVAHWNLDDRVAKVSALTEIKPFTFQYQADDPFAKYAVNPYIWDLNPTEPQNSKDWGSFVPYGYNVPNDESPYWGKYLGYPYRPEYCGTSLPGKFTAHYEFTPYYRWGTAWNRDSGANSFDFLFRPDACRTVSSPQMVRFPGNTASGDLVGTLDELHKLVAGKDFQSALQWFSKAAQEGNPAGMYELGRMYEDGLGVITNKEIANFWYQMAAQLGNTDAKNALSRLEK